MNVVIYTRDLEPITIIDLPTWAIEAGVRRSFVAVDIAGRTDLVPTTEATIRVPLPTFRKVTLEFLAITMGARLSTIIVIRDEELASSLRLGWLPGKPSNMSDYKIRVRELSCVLVDVLARGVGGH